MGMVATSLLSWPLSVYRGWNILSHTQLQKISKSCGQANSQERKNLSPFLKLIQSLEIILFNENSNLHLNYMLGTACPQALFFPPVLLFKSKSMIDRNGSGGGYRLVVTLLN